MKTKSTIKLYSKICAVCSSSFQYEAYPSTEKKQPRKTCSKTCQYSYHRRVAKKIKLQCKHCQKLFQVLPCFSKKVFCSNKCRLMYQKTLTGDQNPAWRPINEKASYRSLKTTLRNKLISKDTICSDCNQLSETLEIHHIDKNRDNNSISNLTVLCKTCHANRHIGERAYNLILKSQNHSKRQKRPWVKCAYCKKDFLLYNKSLKFCSRSCAAFYNNSKK